MSVDPLQVDYPNLSPYNFVANCPLTFIDCDGRKIVPAKSIVQDENKMKKFGTAIDLVKEKNTSVFNYLNTLRYHTGLKEYIDNNSDFYNDADAFDVVIEVDFEDLDNMSEIKEQTKTEETVLDNSNPDLQGYAKRTENTYWDGASKKYEGYAWMLDACDPDNTNIISPVKITPENLNDPCFLIRLTPNKNGDGAHFRIVLDDHFNNVKKMGQVLAHEMGHVLGMILNQTNTYFFEKKAENENNKNLGHSDGEEHGNIADLIEDENGD